MLHAPKVPYEMVDRLPPCTFCGDRTPADFHFRVGLVPWRRGCARHFKEYRGQLGNGKGQPIYTPLSCQLCRDGTLAEYNFKIPLRTSWNYGCHRHFRELDGTTNNGLGVQLIQRIR